MKMRKGLRLAIEKVLQEGGYLSNCAFNLKQSDKLPEGDRRLLDQFQNRWDSAAANLRDHLPRKKQ